MKYLLVDFGASYLKTALYNKVSGEIGRETRLDSPFLHENTLSRQEVHDLLVSTIERYKSEIEAVVFCTILGGRWDGDTYSSWKLLERGDFRGCLISGFFKDSKDYHIHKHHGGESDELKPLGELLGKTIYSALGDTFCVIESLDIQDDEYVVNMGTGSQVISTVGDGYHLDSHIPAGRAFLAFEEFFGSSFFAELNSITVKEVISSDLDINLNVFKQAVKYTGGGAISNIQENNFNQKNLLASVIRCWVLQYGEYFENPSKTKVRLAGGIPSKMPIVKDLFERYYDRPTTIDTSKKLPETIIGISKYINKYL